MFSLLEQHRNIPLFNISLNLSEFFLSSVCIKCPKILEINIKLEMNSLLKMQLKIYFFKKSVLKQVRRFLKLYDRESKFS